MVSKIGGKTVIPRFVSRDVGWPRGRPRDGAKGAPTPGPPERPRGYGDPGGPPPASWARRHCVSSQDRSQVAASPPPSQFRFRLGSVSTRIEPPSPSLPAAFYFSSFGWREATQRWTIAHSIFASAGSGRMHARTWLRPREGRVCPKWSPYEGGTPNFAVRTSRAALFAGCRSPCRSDRSRLARTG